MHIEFPISIEQLTAQQKSHLEQCEDCRLDYQNLIELAASAQQIKLVVPDEDNWLKISEKLHSSKPVEKFIVHNNKRKFYVKQLLAMAATVSLVVMGGLGWSNHQLQNQLEHALLANQQLEVMLNNSGTLTYRKVVLVESLRNLDSELYDANTVKKKLTLLEKRQQIISSYISKGEGEPRVFTI